MIRLKVPGLSDYEIIVAGGWQGLKNIKNALLKVSDRNDKNLIIFDTDRSDVHGGCSKRKEYLTNELKDIGIENNFDIFLFPNHSDDGESEDLFEKIINKKHKSLLHCFDNYLSCIKQLPKINIDYNYPNQKTKMYAYISSIVDKVSFEDLKNKKSWQFDNAEYWDLDSEELKPLINFLKKHLN